MKNKCQKCGKEYNLNSPGATSTHGPICSHSPAKKENFKSTDLFDDLNKEMSLSAQVKKHQEAIDELDRLLGIKAVKIGSNTFNVPTDVYEKFWKKSPSEQEILEASENQDYRLRLVAAHLTENDELLMKLALDENKAVSEYAYEEVRDMLNARTINLEAVKTMSNDLWVKLVNDMKLDEWAVKLLMKNDNSKDLTKKIVDDLFPTDWMGEE